MKPCNLTSRLLILSLFTIHYCSIVAKSQKDTLYAFYNGKKWGAVNRNKEVIVPPQYESLLNMEAGSFYISAISNKQITLYDKKGKVILENFDGDEIEDIYGTTDYIKITKKEKMAIWDIKSNRYKTGFEFDAIWHTYSNKTSTHVIVAKDQKQGLIELASLQYVLPLKYKIDSYYKLPNVIKVSFGNKHGVYHIRKGWLLPISYDEVEIQYCPNPKDHEKNKEILFCKKGNQVKYIDSLGTVRSRAEMEKQITALGCILPSVASRYEEEEPPIADWSLGEKKIKYPIIHTIRKGERQHLISIETSETNKKEYSISGHDSVYTLDLWRRKKTDAFAVIDGGKFGLVDTLGNTKLPSDFDEMKVFCDYVAVRSNGYWGFYDLSQQKIVVPHIIHKWEYAEPPIKSLSFPNTCTWVYLKDNQIALMDLGTLEIYLPK